MTLNPAFDGLLDLLAEAVVRELELQNAAEEPRFAKDDMEIDDNAAVTAGTEGMTA